MRGSRKPGPQSLMTESPECHVPASPLTALPRACRALHLSKCTLFSSIITTLSVSQHSTGQHLVVFLALPKLIIHLSLTSPVKEAAADEPSVPALLHRPRSLGMWGGSETRGEAQTHISALVTASPTHDFSVLVLGIDRRRGEQQASFKPS